MRVLGLGDNVFDIYENCSRAYPGGNAVNVAVNAARLGAEAAYLGAVATDGLGELMLSVLSQEGVETARCPRPAATTTKCCIEDVVDGERVWKRNDLGERWVGPLALTDELVAYASGFDVILSSCNAKMPGELAKLQGAPALVIFDFGEKDKYRTAGYLGQVLPACSLAQFSMSGMSREEVLAEVRRMGMTCPVLATRGADAPLLIAGDAVFEGAASTGAARDTMGAGDAFVTALVCDLVASGWHKGTVPEAAAARHALEAAAAHARRACREAGGFGYELIVRDGAIVVPGCMDDAPAADGTFRGEEASFS